MDGGWVENIVCFRNLYYPFSWYVVDKDYKVKNYLDDNPHSGLKNTFFLVLPDKYYYEYQRLK